MSLEILYQDEHFVAVTKPSGLLVHPYWKETNEKKNLLKDLKAQVGQWLYPIHRLDRPVSGVVIFGLAPEPVKELQARWHDESTKKIYLALAKNAYTEICRFEFALNNEAKVAQDALTIATPLETFTDATFFEVEIKTGRKHQIRRHFSRRCSQIIGDRMYGKKPTNDFYRENLGLERIFLHAHQLSFLHPYTNERVTITSPLPEELARPLENLRRLSQR